jgi:hypothetical protein
MKNSDTIGNRSRDLPVCSSVPKTLHHRVPLLHTMAKLIYVILYLGQDLCNRRAFLPRYHTSASEGGSVTHAKIKNNLRLQ